MDVIQSVVIGPCLEATLTVTGVPGTPVWLWVGPVTFEAPFGEEVLEFDYLLTADLGPVATEPELDGSEGAVRLARQPQGRNPSPMTWLVSNTMQNALGSISLIWRCRATTSRTDRAVRITCRSSSG